MERLKELIEDRILSLNKIQSSKNGHHTSDLELYELLQQETLLEGKRKSEENYILTNIQMQAKNDLETLSDGFESVESLVNFVCEIVQIVRKSNAKDEESDCRQSPKYLKDLFLHLKVDEIQALGSEITEFRNFLLRKNNLESIGRIVNHLCLYSRLKYEEHIELVKIPNPVSSYVSESFISRKRSKTQADKQESTVEVTENKEMTEMRENKERKISRSLILYNRATLYSYLSLELQSCYSTLGIPDLDFEALKDLRRRRMKSLLLEPENMKKAVDVIMDSDANKNIKNAIKNYEKEFLIYKENKALKCSKGKRKEKTEKSIINKMVSISECISTPKHSPKSVSEVKPPKKDPIRKTISICQDQEVSKSDQEQIFMTIRGEIKSHFLPKPKESNRERLRLPSLSHSMQEKTNFSLMKFPGSKAQHSESCCQGNSNGKNEHRDSLQKMLVKNFIGARRKKEIKHNPEQKMQAEQNYFEKHNEFLGKIESKKTMKVEGIIFLRRKTNAILENLRTMNNG